MSDRVWFLAHPLAADEEVSLEQNMESIRKKLKILIDRGIIVYAPYYGNIAAGVRETDEMDRGRWLLASCRTLDGFDGMILWGHKFARGMNYEYNCFMGKVVNIIGYSDEVIASMLDHEFKDLFS